MTGHTYEHIPDSGLGLLEVYKYPNRKQWGLFLTKDGVSQVLAWFPTEEKAGLFMQWLSKSSLRG